MFIVSPSALWLEGCRQSPELISCSLVWRDTPVAASPHIGGSSSCIRDIWLRSTWSYSAEWFILGRRGSVRFPPPPTPASRRRDNSSSQRRAEQSGWDHLRGLDPPHDKQETEWTSGETRPRINRRRTIELEAGELVRTQCAGPGRPCVESAFDDQMSNLIRGSAGRTDASPGSGASKKWWETITKVSLAAGI